VEGIIYVKMTKKTTKSQTDSKSIVRKETLKETEEFLKSLVGTSTDPKYLLEKVNKAMNAYINSDEKDKEDKLQALNDQVNKVFPVYALDNHTLASETVSERLQPMVRKMATDLVIEYECNSSSEKALAQMVASSYGRYLQYAKFYQNVMHIEWLSTEKTRHYESIAKEADKAHRQFITALTTLRQIKSPPPSIKITAKQAFIAENQQLNAIGKDREKEIING